MLKPSSIAIRPYKAVRIKNGEISTVEEPVSEETPLTVYLNGQELVTILCSPQDEKHLAVGFLVAEGMVSDISSITSLTVDAERGLVWAEADNVPDNAGRRYVKRCLTACCGRGRAEFHFANDARVARRIDSQLRVKAASINRYAAALEKASATHQATHGVHSGAIAAAGELLCYAEDIGRHNVFDKLYGKCLAAGLPTTDKLIVFSGRVSSEILLKVSKMGVPIVAARSVPTSLAIDMARELGITLVGVARGDWFQVYSQAERIETD